MQNAYVSQEFIRKKSQNTTYFSLGYSKVHVDGYSLDVTEKDILKNLLEPDYTILDIYVYGKVNEGKLLSNLIKIIGEDMVIKKANSIPRGIEMHVI